MSTIFVEEGKMEIRRDNKFFTFFKRFGLYILGGFIIVAVIVTATVAGVLANRGGEQEPVVDVTTEPISFGLPMGIFLVEGYAKGIPVSLEEAAAIDGSSFSRTLWQIIMPMCKPILVTIAIIQIFSCWNEFSFALVLIENVHLQTVPLALTQFKGQFGSDYPKQMAAMLITMLPIVVLYFAFSKQIIKGMVAGAVKG